MKVVQAGFIPALVLAFALGTSAAYAQTTPAPAPAAPGPAAPAPNMMMKKPMKPMVSADQKASISKSCSAAADKQGLKGKPRKSFREKCKHAGGPAM